MAKQQQPAKNMKQTQQPSKPKQQEVKPSDVKKLPATTGKSSSVTEYDEEMLAAMGADAGKGVSTKAEDNIVPLIYILQAQSPQVLRQKAEHIQGAQAGNFWYRGTKDVVDGDEGMECVLCHMRKLWIEWRQDRGGFVMRHDEKPEDAEWTPDPKNPKKGQWVLPNGNYVAETREHVVYIPERNEAYVLPLSGSNHGAARQWMSSAKRKCLPGTSTKAPLWGYLWTIKTVARSNDEGDWFGLLVEESSNEDGSQKLTWQLDGGKTYRECRQFHDDFEAGVKQSDQGEEVVDTTGDEIDQDQEEHV